MPIKQEENEETAVPVSVFLNVLAVRQCPLWPLNPAYFLVWTLAELLTALWQARSECSPPFNPPQLPTAQFTSRSPTHTHAHTQTLRVGGQEMLSFLLQLDQKTYKHCAASPIPADAWLPHIYIGKCRTNGFTYQTLCVIGAALGPPHKSSGRAALEPEVGGSHPEGRLLNQWAGPSGVLLCGGANH